MINHITPEGKHDAILIPVQITCLDVILATIPLKPTPDPNSKTVRLSNNFGLDKMKSANKNAPLQI